MTATPTINPTEAQERLQAVLRAIEDLLVSTPERMMFSRTEIQNFGLKLHGIAYPLEPEDDHG